MGVGVRVDGAVGMGVFMYFFFGNMHTINPYFKIDYYDKITYFECSQDFLADKNLVKKYCESLFRKI